MNTPRAKTLKKSIASLLMVALLLPGLATPRPAHALFGVGDIVLDPTNLVQNTVNAVEAIDGTLLKRVLDPLAWAVAKTAIQSMTRSIVTWINGGFNGSPAFEQDLTRSLRQLGDTTAQNFLTQLANESAVHSPFIDDLIKNVGAGYYLYTGRDALKERLRYTLSKSSTNDKAFLAGDFSQGGWDAWFAAFSNPANNPYGAQMYAAQELANQISGNAEKRVQELSWGGGFLSWRGDCTKDSDGTDATALAEIDDCQSYSVQTPGSVIEQTLIPNLNSPLHQLELADSFNEIVGALATQLVSKVLGGGGLAGVSQPSQGGGRSTLSSATDASQYSTSSLGTGFAQTLTTTITRISQYKANLVSLKGAAERAKSACTSNSSVMTDPIESTITRATIGVAEANDVLASLQAMSVTVAGNQASGASTQSSDMVRVSSDYQALIASSIFPSSEETAKTASDASTASSASLIYRLNYLADNGCKEPS